MKKANILGKTFLAMNLLGLGIRLWYYLEYDFDILDPKLTDYHIKRFN